MVVDCAGLVAGGARWPHLGPAVLARGGAGSFDSGIVGDPCIVWDEDAGSWRMFYFALGESFVGTGVARARRADRVDPGDWLKEGPLAVAGPLAERCHKLWVLTDPRRPGRAVRLAGEYVAFFTTFRDGAKVVGRARAGRLAGPWRTDDAPVVPNGAPGTFDGRGADAVTAYWFPDRARVALFYMAYPDGPQPEQPRSPLGPCQAVALLDPRAACAEKLGPTLRPGGDAPAWCGGWIGGLQLLPTASPGRWVALLNGSPTPVDGGHGEPDPSVAGWARCEEDLPVRGWTLDRDASPIERPEALAAEARRAGEGTNFWRHHLLPLPGGGARMYYNSGAYGAEQIYARGWRG